MTAHPVTESGLPEPAPDEPAVGVARCRLVVDDEGRPYDCLFLETSAVFEEMTGLPDAGGTLLSELRPDEVHPWLSGQPTVSLDRRHLSIELSSRSTQRSFAMTVVPMGDPTEIAVVVRDTSDSDRRLDDLARSEAEFRALADHLPLMVWVHDADGNQQFVNQTYCDYFGVDRDQMKDDHWQVLTHPDDGAAYIDDFAAALRKRRRFHREVRVQRADGEWRWLESWGTPRFEPDGSYVGHIGASADVTVRKRAQIRLAKNAAFTDRVLDSLVTFAGVLTMDGTVLSANRAPLELADLTLADVVGRPFWECFWWNYDDEVMARLRHAIARSSGGSVVRYDVDVQMAGGRLLPIDFQVAPLRDDDGTITNLVVSGIDLTARKSAEQVVERTLVAERKARVRAETLEAVAKALSAAIGVDEAAHAIVDTVALDDTETLSVVIERNGRLFGAAIAGVAADVEFGNRSAPLDDDGPLAEIFRHRRPVLIDHRADFMERFPEHAHLAQTIGFESVMASPLLSTSGEALGVLAATSSEAAHFDADRHNLLLAIAAQAGGALERARLHEQAEQQRRFEARALARAEVIAQALTEIEQAQQVGHQVVRLVEVLVPRVADFVTIEDPALDDPVLALAHRDRDQGATLAALRRRHRLDADDPQSVAHVIAGSTHRMTGLTSEVRADYARTEDARALLERLGVHSFLAVPIDLGPSRPGVLLCGLSDPDRRPYDDADEAFLTEIAQRTGAILTATALREQEHESLLRLQKALLPDRLRDHPAIDVAARYEAAASVLAVGGDWYDTFVWDDRHYGIVIGDVVGHGIDAAAAMGRLRAASATLIAAGEPNPRAILGAIERCAGGPDGIDFLTAFVAVVDTETGRLRYASAGHPPALVIRSDSEPLVLDDALSAPICSLKVGDRPHAAVDLAPDDVVVAFTDGLVERRDRSVHDGLAELRALARTLRDNDVEDLNRILVEQMVADSGDDVVAVSLRFAPSGDRFQSRFPAKRTELAPLRNRLGTWLERNAVDPDLHQRVMLGTAEACANAVEHAYRSLEPGTISVRAGWDGSVLVVVVSDAGVWQEAQTSSVNRGRGLTIIDRVADTMTRITGPTGTTITMRYAALPASAD
ncbi:MAG: SpoIIE family protein phosphatase [Acidimicrobiales bacterium]